MTVVFSQGVLKGVLPSVEEGSEMTGLEKLQVDLVAATSTSGLR
jgi:hypothetical protein